MMDMYGFYTGKIFDAYEYLGAQLSENGTMFRTFAPNADHIALIGEFSGWNEIQMNKAHDGNFYECFVPEAREGMMYKYRVYRRGGGCVDHCDPYGYGMEVRPNSASIIRSRSSYTFHDQKWMKKRSDNKDRPLNIYEVHLGSWRMNGDQWYNYEEIAERLIPYLTESGYNAVEIMPICEYPNDASWGYQAIGFYSPTSRYGTADQLKAFVDKCHENQISVILDFAPVHFAVDSFGLAEFDGTALYEYPHRDVAFNEWGSKNFLHSRGEVRSYLQSSVYYWIKEFHMDGIRVDAVSNMIYWQGNPGRGVNQGAVRFIEYMNGEIKKEYPDVMLIAEDSTSYPRVTKPVSQGGLGFDYKWDMGWMNDTLQFFKETSDERIRDYHKITFSMHYFPTEQYLLPLSHDEVVHGKATILQKMNGDYEGKFPQGRAFYLYMYAHPGKKLNFMANEIGQLREWDEKREQDWNLLDFPNHSRFYRFMRDLNRVYLNHPALYERDYRSDGFLWTDCTNEYPAVYSFLRMAENETMFFVMNTSDRVCDYRVTLPEECTLTCLLDSDWDIYGGAQKAEQTVVKTEKKETAFSICGMSAKLFLVTRDSAPVSGETCSVK